MEKGSALRTPFFHVMIPVLLGPFDFLIDFMYGDISSFSVASPEELLEASFAFLLAREPNTSIMSEFSLMVIPRYFPDYEQEIISTLQPDV